MNQSAICRMVMLSLALWVSLSSCSNLPAAQNQPQNGHTPQAHSSIAVPSAKAEHPESAESAKVLKPEHSELEKSESAQSEPASESNRSAESSEPAHLPAESSEQETEPKQSENPSEAAQAEAEPSERTASPQESESSETAESSESSTLAGLIEDLKTKVMLESGIPTTDLMVQEAKAVEWSDSCLDLPQPDEMCAQVITSGYRIVLSNLTVTFEFHTDRTGRLVRQVQAEKP